MKWLVALLLWCTQPAYALDLLDQRVLDPSVFWAYSTAPGPLNTPRNATHLYTGGWEDESAFTRCTNRSGDASAPCDVIYLRTLQPDNTYSEPKEILSRPSKYLNDPTLIRCGTRDCLYMTEWDGVIDHPSTASLAIMRGNPARQQWRWVGAVVTAENSVHAIDESGTSVPCGAWAPSAFIYDNAPRLAYHLPWGPCDTRMIRTTLSTDGRSVLYHEELTAPRKLVNIDLMPWRTGCLMVGDAGSHFQEIWLFVSDDCLHFDYHPAVGERPIFDAGDFAAFTPSLRRSDDPNIFHLQFTYTAAGLGDLIPPIFIPWTTSLHEWTWRDD